MNVTAQPPSECIETQSARADRQCKIVTFYEEFPDAIRAHKAFDGIAETFSRGLPVHATSWSFDLLGRRELNAAILRDSALADVIVVATDGRTEVPDRIRTWIEVCMNANAGARPVVVALHDEGLEPDGAAAPLCSSLKQIADRRNAAFMCNDDLGICANHETVAEPIRARHAHPGAAFETAFYPATETLRWWGMND